MKSAFPFATTAILVANLTKKTIKEDDDEQIKIESLSPPSWQLIWLIVIFVENFPLYLSYLFPIPFANR